MSFLFDKKTKAAMKWIWIVFSIVIIISMTFVFSGGHRAVQSGSGSRSQNITPSASVPQETAPSAHTQDVMDPNTDVDDINFEVIP